MAGEQDRQQGGNAEDFLSSYIEQVKHKLEKAPVRPDATPKESLVHSDEEAPKNRRRFYTDKQKNEIALEECAECEYEWRKCALNPPSTYDRFFGCRKLRREYYDCMERAKARLEGKSGSAPLVDDK
ncbi:hypothetical protein GGI12_002514 [Dipsacomyces acuminosporus]|nr:hypothetical protein GGI12_002514 [Dipsacomyces acuminosporus]